MTITKLLDYVKISRKVRNSFDSDGIVWKEFRTLDQRGGWNSSGSATTIFVQVVFHSNIVVLSEYVCICMECENMSTFSYRFNFVLLTEGCEFARDLKELPQISGGMKQGQVAIELFSGNPKTSVINLIIDE